MIFAWMSNPQYLAQVGHTLGGALLIVTSTLFSIVLGAGWTPVLWTFGIGVTLATLKEFVFDTATWGEGDSWSDSLMDWAFYMVGGATGIGVAALAFHLAGTP
jgi:hypothetical protein